MAGTSSVTPDILSQAMLMLERMQDDDIGELALSIENMQYQGFNPKQYLAHLWGKAKAAGMSQEAHMKAVKSMACLGLIRGSKIKKLTARGTPALQKAVAEWKTVYSLTDGKPAGPFTVTLVRTSASLAMMLSRGLHNGLAGLQGTIQAESVAPGFPKGMALSTFGSLIPTTIDPDSVVLLKKAFYYHQYIFDRTINAEPKDRSNRENLVKYADIQISSDLYSQDQRIAHCRELGIIENVNGVIKLTITASMGVNTAAAAWDAAQF